MGIFSSSDEEDVDEEVKKLVENANHPSVTAKLLTKKSPGLLSGHHLAEKPLIDYLQEGEQPHMIIGTQKIRTKLNDERKTVAGGTAAVVITDLRIIIAKTNAGKDEIISVPLEGISRGDTKHKSDFWKATNKLILYADIDFVPFEIHGVDKNEIDDIMSSSLDVQIRIAVDGKTSGTDVDKALAHITAKGNEFRNVEGKEKVLKYIEEDEEIVKILNGKEAVIEQELEADSRYSGEGVHTVITDQRVFAVIGQEIKDERLERIDYEKIDTINLDKGISSNLSITTGSRTYRFNVYDVNKAEESVNYI
ncbi:PH domain-containing protein [Haloglomus halophilum]|uniref:PH domain-containing protein n=1 Tax=Haloglomus halophilum TaxID=2962672 RepID=UPI0020C97AD4|nr:PH domain-containing protein [Haloglomus halophilum]